MGVRGGRDWEFGISKCKLVYIGWINKKVILNSMGNYIQYPVINCNGNNMKMNISMYITESFCYLAEFNTTLQIEYIP